MTGRNILFVDGSPVIGGAQRSLLALMKELAAHDVQVSLLTGSDELAEQAGKAGVESEAIPLSMWSMSLSGAVKAAGDLMRFRKVLHRRLDSSQAELVYANGVQAGLLVALTIPDHMPMVFHHRDIRCPGFAVKQAVRRSARTIVLTEYMAHKVRSQLPESAQHKLTCVYNGFDFDELRVQAEEPLAEPLPDAAIRVALVADIMPWKKHELFLQALAALKRQGHDILGVVVGGPRTNQDRVLFERLKRSADELDLAGRVLFTGRVPNAMPLIKAADCLCSVAEEEPFGRTVVEAAAVGTPIVVGGNGGPKEITNGLSTIVYSELDAADVAHAIEDAIEMPRDLPSEQWLSRFSIQQHADGVMKLISAI